MDLFSANIAYLPGIGTKRAELLKKELHVECAMDLLRIYPYKYIDRSKFYKICELESEDAYVQIIGEIINWQTIGIGKHQRLSAMFCDGTHQVELVWFGNFKYVKLEKGKRYLLFGKPTIYNHQFNFPHPELTPLDHVNLEAQKGLEPHYNTSERMKESWLNSKAMRKIILGLMPQVRQGLPDTLPSAIREQYHLVDLTTAIINIHFPADYNALQRAKERLKFEELFYIQLHILRQMKARERKQSGLLMPIVGRSFNDFYFNHLPFTLTGAQKRVIKEIQGDLKSGIQMNRLLQGDVGSGKTLVALLCALLANDNGYQACLMAPTEILANQHYKNLCKMTAGTATHIALLTGSTTPKQRAELWEGLLNGQINLLIGTHALLEDNVQFANLGLVIIDEQHRFGVAQRAKMWAKNITPPHILVMTATPIPRTLAMTVYGDLRVSVIDELPPGRKPVFTTHYTILHKRTVYEAVRKQLAQGRQAYFVYPLIEESKNMDMEDLQRGYEEITHAFPEYSVSICHGKMKASEKDEEMRKFSARETQILVATTVIEVGVDVPNASVMVIVNAEQFGLSQLHQLRGRVGRGADQSYCILLTKVELSKETRQRMETMVASNDGFKIAEADLQLRGPGDLEGTQQSGLPFELKIASLSTDGQVLEIARSAAMNILEDDPELKEEKNMGLVAHLNRLKPITANWSDIS